MEFILFTILSFIVCTIFFKNYHIISKKFKLIDRKNLHYANNVTPTGSGVIFSIIFIFGNILFYFLGVFENLVPNRFYLILVSALILSITSFRDDFKSIDPILRLLIQFGCVYISIACLNLNEIDIPLKLLIIFIFLIWIYITNITNFIDGTDGFLISHVIFVLINILLLFIFGLDDIFSAYISIIVLPSAIIFLYFNFPKAKLFMGDAGSIFFGFIIGYIFLEILLKGYWNIALSIMAYPLLDCSICLFKKLRKGIMPWIGIYDYYFLKPALANKKNHKKIFLLYLIFNFLNLFVIQFQYYTDIKYIFILSFIISFGLIYIFDNFKKFNFFYK